MASALTPTTCGICSRLLTIDAPSQEKIPRRY
jgi:hypothetical protein